jgi:hypothetical protein
MRRVTFRSILACLLIAFALWLFVAKASRRMPDFEVYWRAGARAAAAEPLYRPSDEDYQLKYFPAFAIAAIPLGLLPLDTAKAVWFALSAAALAVLLPLSVTLLPHRRQPIWLLIGVLLIGLGKYYAEDLVLGQINTLVALVAALALLALSRGREAVGGLLVALAIVLKPYALILAPWIAARRQRPSIVALGVGLLVAGVLPAFIYGLDGTVGLYRDWWRTVTTTTDGTLLHSDNVSLASLWAKRLGIGAAATSLATMSSIALLIAAAVVFLRRTGVERPEGAEAALLLAITPLISPQGWDYVLVLGTMTLLYIVNDFDQLPRAVQALTVGAIAAVGLTLYDLLGRRPIYALLDLSVITIGMVALIGVLCTLRMRKLA